MFKHKGDRTDSYVGIYVDTSSKGIEETVAALFKLVTANASESVRLEAIKAVTEIHKRPIYIQDCTVHVGKPNKEAK